MQLLYSMYYTQYHLDHVGAEFCYGQMNKDKLKSMCVIY